MIRNVFCLLIICGSPALGSASSYESLGSLQVYRTVNKVIHDVGKPLAVPAGEAFDYGLVLANRRGAASLQAFELREALLPGTEYAGPSSLKPWPHSVPGRLLRTDGRELVFEVGELKGGASSTVFVRLVHSGGAEPAQAVQGSQLKLEPKVTATPPPVPQGKDLVAGLSADKQTAVVGLRIPREGRYWLKARNLGGELVLQKDLGQQAAGPISEMLRVAQLAPGLYLLTLEAESSARPLAAFKLMVPR
jgi:hypothetical protein